MEIKKAPATLPQRSLSTNSAPAAPAHTSAAAPQEHVTLGQLPSPEQAAGLLQQMAQARVELGHQLIGEVLEPAPQEFQAVSQATAPMRDQIANQIAEQTGAPTDAFYLLATETKTLAQAAVNAESRADFQAGQGLSPDRSSLLQQELGFLVEANIYQGVIPADQLQQMLPQTEPEGEKTLSAGTFIEFVRQHVPAETAQQVTESARQNPLLKAFQNADLEKRFVGALDQNFQAALQVNQGCLGYFGVLSQIMQNEAVAISVLSGQTAPAQA